MEKGDMSFFHGQASDGSRFTRPPPPTQEILLTSPFLQTANNTLIMSNSPRANNRYVHTSPIVDPAARFAATRELTMTSLSLSNTMNSNDRFVFMPTPSLPSSSRIIKPTTISSPFGFGMMNPNPYVVANQRVPCPDALGSSFLNRAPPLPEAYILDSTSPTISFCPRIQPPYIQYQQYLKRAPPLPEAYILDSTSPTISFCPRTQPPYIKYQQHLNPYLNVNPNNSQYTFQSHDNLLEYLLEFYPREENESFHIHKCSLCDIEFPTAQAYGGHMSSHSKTRKVKMTVQEASKRPRLIPLIHEHKEGSHVYVKMSNENGTEEVPTTVEAKKEEEEDDELLEDDGGLKYLVEEDQNIETDQKVIAKALATISENSVNSEPKTNGGTTPSNVH